MASWDNLTNKGRVQLVPDRVVLWNDFQKHEAVEMHDIPAERIVVTGAQLYDEWFARKPTRDYETFCRTFGFDPSKPMILYCGSSIFIARDEVEFVRRVARQDQRRRAAGAARGQHFGAAASDASGAVR